MPLKGYDASWDPPDMQCMKDGGYRFLVRYSSRDPSKNLTQAEADQARSLGMGLCVVFQEGKTQMLRGYAGGQADARTADDFTRGLALAGIPVYFSADWDVQDHEQDEVNGYLDGAASVIGRGRTGIYGGYNAVRRALDAGKAAWAWQCYAWSGTPTQWDSRAQLRQVRIDYARCAGYIDDDEAWADDYGQWPRPGGDGGGTVAVAHYGGQPYYAGIWADGKVNFRPPGGSWRAVDPGQSGALSGCGIAVSDAGEVIITYVNAAGAACTYRRAPGSSDFTWASVSPEGSFR
jgi:hypothetical protein